MTDLRIKGSAKRRGMEAPIRVLVLGTGQMGSAMARLVLARPGLELAGACARRPGRAGMDLGRAIGLDRALGLPIVHDLEEAVARSRPRVALQATCSRLAEARGEIEILLRHGVRVITIAEEMACPAATDPGAAAALDRLAREHGAALLGTGINPGFVLDLLVITLTGVCAEVRSIRAERINDLSPYGPTVLESQGVGLSPEDFRAGLAEGRVVGHVGFRQSIGLIAGALGWTIDRIEELREPIVSAVRRETSCVTVEPGQVAGCLHTATAWRRGEPAIILVHPQQVRPDLAGAETGDRIEIDGSPPVRLAGSPEIPGGQGTAALAVNMIPHLLNAAPGLHTMADLPVPAARLGDARHWVRGREWPEDPTEEARR